MRISIYGKILIVMVVLFTVAAAVFFREAHRTGHELLTSLSHDRAHAVADVGLRTIEQHMLRKDRQEIAGYLEALAESQHARKIQILNSNGDVLFSADTLTHFESVPIDEYEVHPDFPEHRFKMIEESETTYEYYVWPLHNRQECLTCHTGERDVLGYIGVEIPLDDIRGYAETHRTSNLRIAVAVFVGLGLMLALAILLLVVRPINRLKRQVHVLEEHIPGLQRGEPMPDLAWPERKSPDEIASLGNSFRNLLQRLNSAYSELIELHDQHLERADQLASAGEMAASIAHEIKNPVSGVKAALQVFLRKTEDDDPNREVLEEMIVQLNRITHAVNDLLSYARSAPPEFTQVSVDDVVERTISLMLAEIEHREIELRLQLANKGHYIEADQKQVQQVIWNIMLNAVQSMPLKGYLGVVTEQKNGSTIVEISDTGQGIPREELDRIFKPFYTTKCKGSGLGMAIARRIMQQHGGGIHLTSKVQHGTTVRLTFPNNQL